MANRAVKQPNGLYARFSDIVDDFTHVNCTREELLEFYQGEIGLLEGTAKLDRADAVLWRFDDEIRTVEAIHGKGLAEKRREEMSEAKKQA